MAGLLCGIAVGSELVTAEELASFIQAQARFAGDSEAELSGEPAEPNPHLVSLAEAVRKLPEGKAAMFAVIAGGKRDLDEDGD